VLFPHINHSEFLVPTHNIRGMIGSEKNNRTKLMFLEHTVAVICPHYHFSEKVVKSCDIFWIYSGNLSRTASTIIPVTSCLNQLRSVGGAMGLKGRHLWVVCWLQGCGSSEDGDKREPEPSRVLLKCTLLSRVHEAICLHAQHRQAW
jgi:hypothetical protein